MSAESLPDQRGIVVIGDCNGQSDIAFERWPECVREDGEVQEITRAGAATDRASKIANGTRLLDYVGLISRVAAQTNAVADGVVRIGEIQFGIIAINSITDVRIHIAVGQAILAGERPGDPKHAHIKSGYGNLRT